MAQIAVQLRVRDNVFVWGYSDGSGDDLHDGLHDDDDRNNYQLISIHEIHTHKQKQQK